jgi:hypothetical protein
MAAIDYPSSSMPVPSSFSISPIEHVIGTANPYTFSREIMLRAHQWHATIEWNHTDYQDCLRLIAHLSRSRMGAVTLKIPLFHYHTKRGTKAGSVTLSGAHPAGSTSLTITGGSGLLLQGDWISIDQVSDVPRAYLVVSSETAGAIQIIPGLRGAQSNGDLVRHLTQGLILDTMEVVTDLNLPAWMPSPLPGYFYPFSVELVSALRRVP